MSRNALEGPPKLIEKEAVEMDGTPEWRSNGQEKMNQTPGGRRA